MSNILFISPDYFSYSDFIKREMEKRGNVVDWFDDRPSKGILEKCLLRAKPSLMKKKIEDYFYKYILESAKKKNYDIVFVIMGQSFAPSMFIDLKRALPHSYFVLYLWDSVKNFPNSVALSKAFDKTFSFEKNDCDKYSYSFLPLFYSEDLSQNFVSEPITYDALFIGTIKRGKLPYLTSLYRQLSKRMNCYFYCYLQSRLVYFYDKIYDKDFKHAHLYDFNYKKMSYSENISLLSKSRIVIDVNMSNQTGLSIRCFEALAYKKKMITTNGDIKTYDFYNPKNIYVFDGKSIDFDDDFFKTDYFQLPKETYYKYSIHQWINTILERCDFA